MIVDLTVNYGGFDFVARAIAERFASEPTHACTTYVGDADQPIRARVILNPSRGTRFEGRGIRPDREITVLPDDAPAEEGHRAAIQQLLSRI